MTTNPVEDQGQELSGPAGKVIGFLDGHVEYSAFADALKAAGFAPSEITTLHGQDGIQLLERLKEHSFFFGDSEDNIIKQSIRQLEKGHYAVAVDVKNHKQALEVQGLAAPHQGHDFTYFGTWLTEKLPT